MKRHNKRPAYSVPPGFAQSQVIQTPDGQIKAPANRVLEPTLSQGRVKKPQ